jgi:hypothetical protein
MLQPGSLRILVRGIRTDEVGNEEEDVLRVRLLRGKVQRDCWIDKVDVLRDAAPSSGYPVEGRVLGHEAVVGVQMSERGRLDGAR